MITISISIINRFDKSPKNVRSRLTKLRVEFFSIVWEVEAIGEVSPIKAPSAKSIMEFQVVQESRESWEGLHIRGDEDLVQVMNSHILNTNNCYALEWITSSE